MEYVKGYMRDPGSQVLINNDEKQYKDHVWKMELATKMKHMQNDIDVLKRLVMQLQTQLKEKS